MIRNIYLIGCLLGMGFPVSAAAESGVSYELSPVETPARVNGKVGGLSFAPSGRLAACFHSGDVFFLNPETGVWAQFAEGLHEPLGILALSDEEAIVVQRPEVTRLEDVDGDGWADIYETLSDDYGMSGNYHEFAFGPAVGADGSLFISLNTASNGAGIFDELRGEFLKMGRPGRMYSCVPYRGWTLRVNADGSLEPWASGFRSPNGIGFDLENRLFVTDNQGDWLGANHVYHVEKGEFYGHVASLVWRPDVHESALNWPLERLDKMRRRPAFVLPHGELSNSPTQPIPFPAGAKFGPFSGQLLIGEMNHEKLIRAMPEVVGGRVQGAAVAFHEGHGMRKGSHRMVWGPEGDLWIGHTYRDRGWVGGQGIQRMRWTGVAPMEVQWMRLTADGFELDFTKALSARPSSHNFAIERFYFEYHTAYGSDRFGVSPVAVETVSLSEDRKTARLTLDELKPGYVYKLTVSSDVVSADGKVVEHPTLYYTLNALLDGTTGAPQFSQ